jgi:hypothetical protein
LQLNEEKNYIPTLNIAYLPHSKKFIYLQLTNAKTPYNKLIPIIKEAMKSADNLYNEIQSILINLEKAANYLKKNAKSKTTGYCARYVTDALYEAGFTFQRLECAHLYWYYNILNEIGYIEIDKPNSYIT